MDGLFTADSICKRFGERQVLSSASVWVTPGRVTALLGRNGCGKTTLLRIGAGLLAADAGAVHFGGRCRLRPRLASLARDGLFYLPAEGLLPWQLTVARSLAWLAAAFGQEDRVAPAVAAMRLEPFLDLHPYALSGGELRRAEMAAVLTRRPRCLLADEPFRGIAPLDAELFASALRTLALDGCALICTGHEVRALLELADDVIWMVAGTTHFLGSPTDALRHDHFCRDYLGPAPAAPPPAAASAEPD